MNKKTLSVLLSLSLALLAGAPRSLGAQALQPLNLAIGFIPHIQFAPLYVGIEKGFYAQEGIELKIQYGFGIDIFSLLTARRIDIGLSDSDQLIIAGSKNIPLKAVFQYYQVYPVAIVAKRERVGRPEDFVGKTIGTPELFGTSYIGLRLFLDHFGLTGRTRVERIGFTQIPTLLADRVDGVVCFFNNEPVQMRELGMDIVQWDVKDFSEMVGASFITSADLLRDRRDILQRFVRATERAIAYTVDNQEEALNLSLPYLGGIGAARRSFLAAVLEATSRLFESPGGYGHLDEARYAASIEEMRRIGLIREGFPASRILERLR